MAFKDEPGEGSGVARSFYVAFAQAILSSEKLPSLEGTLVGGKPLQYSTSHGLGSERGGLVYIWRNGEPFQSVTFYSTAFLGGTRCDKMARHPEPRHGCLAISSLT